MSDKISKSANTDSDPEIYKKWKKIKDVGFKDFIHGALQLKDLNPRREQTRFEEITKLLFYRSSTSFEATQLLCENGYRIDAYSLVRNMILNLIDMTYINMPKDMKEKKLRAELFDRKMFIDFDRSKIINPECKKKYLNILNESKALLEKEYSKIICKGYKYIAKHTWSGLSLSEMARECNLTKVHEIYETLSNFAHSNMLILEPYAIKRENDLIGYRVGKDFEAETFALGLSNHVYLKTLIEINKVFNLHLESKLKELESGNTI